MYGTAAPLDCPGARGPDQTILHPLEHEHNWAVGRMSTAHELSHCRVSQDDSRRVVIAGPVLVARGRSYPLATVDSAFPDALVRFIGARRVMVSSSGTSPRHHSRG